MRLEVASKQEFQPLCELFSARWHRLAGDHASAARHLHAARQLADSLGLPLAIAECEREAQLLASGSRPVVA